MFTKKQTFPVLPLRDIVMFPGVIAPLFVGRQKSVMALEKSIQDYGSKLFIVAQKDPSIDNPSGDQIHKIGVLVEILQLLKLPDGTVKVLIEAISRMRLKKFIAEGSFFQAEIEDIKDLEFNNFNVEALARSVKSKFSEYVQLNNKINPEIVISLSEIKEPSKLADNISAHLDIEIFRKQEILEEVNLEKRLEKIYIALESEIGILSAERKIRQRVKKQMEKTQKDYYLNEQMKAIQRELGSTEEGKSEIDDLENKINKVKLSKEAKEKVTSELKKYKMMSPMSAEAGIVRNYIDTILNLPWGIKDKINIDINKAQKILDNDHYGLEKIKERILEYLAVQSRTKSLKGPILCLVGPPGVGKTSLAKSIADSTKRKLVRFSLGGVRDESEIRGHRRTYIGAMPGKIMQLIKKSKTSNPVMLLDEIDKMGHDFRGDPASALLEVLDPEQNDKFVDHYLEVEYNLSNIMFIATANTLDIPIPLLDRMEVIRLSGYTEEEKIQIAKLHLVKKQIEAHGLKPKEIIFNDDAFKDIVRYYTREAGVRNLEKSIAKICRKVVKEIIEGKSKEIIITSKNLSKYLGVKKFDYGRAEEKDLVGITTGLAYTEFGGELLLIESVTLPGKGSIKCTGKLGEVMHESVETAFSYFKSRSKDYGVKDSFYQEKDVHIHVPEGAVPKDGPSAGIAMFTSIVSLMVGIPVKKTVAMTGEITLRGRVIGIGGLKEKLLAALRGGIKTVIIPYDNKKDLVEIPKNIKEGLEIIPVKNAEEVLKIALTKPLKKIGKEKIDIL